MWEHRLNLEIHECGNASVEREWRNANEQGGKRKAKWRLAKKNGTGEREQNKKMKYTEGTSVKREEIRKRNERETSGAHQNDVEGKRMAGAQHVGPLQE